MTLAIFVIISLCIAVDNMVIANMSGAKPQNKTSCNNLAFKIALLFMTFNCAMLIAGYIVGYIWTGGNWGPKTVAWVSFAFIALIGVRLLLESIEKSPSFSISDEGLNKKLVKVSALVACNYALLGFVVYIGGGDLMWNLFLLLIISLASGILGFSLGKPSAKTNVSGKKIETVAGIILVACALYSLLNAGIW